MTTLEGIAPTTPQITTINRSCPDQAELPGWKNALNTAVMKWRIGKKVEILASVEPDLSGNQRPDRNSSTKNTVLVTGPAACWFGMNVLIATPSAAKLIPPTTSTTTRAPIPDAPEGR